ncbi:PREDICTED: uncharacterized protein LOC109582747 [Amphimedon queenslandica]|uniref:MD-2-related lipid-recognition domain-containing protein n=1 Tax=Amphimedon queenslandica TaxID=400682 RepID=A0AAN0J877_AMPQE|nr:PREDICTED: uncharacterized protein LOC109582747 [Amphimedon queenslandica]|eukprot:XP_019853219.1 PREDICTED: uncharacterized protein LOC109582747 [Amphimedon queenslandica]
MTTKMNYHILLFLALAVFVVSENQCKESRSDSGKEYNFTSCDAETHKHLQLSQLNISPYPIIRGKCLHVKGLLHASSKIDWAIIKFKAVYKLHKGPIQLNITIIDEQLNFCDFCVEAIQHYCPVLPGVYHINEPVVIPSIFWTGEYEMRVSIFNDKNDKLFCGKAFLHIK